MREKIVSQLSRNHYEMFTLWCIHIIVVFFLNFTHPLENSIIINLIVYIFDITS